MCELQLIKNTLSPMFTYGVMCCLKQALLHTLITSSLPSLVRTSPFPEEQIILTVVANGSSTEGIMGDLQLELDRLAGKFQCQFRNLQRYGEPGCTCDATAIQDTILTASQLLINLFSCKDKNESKVKKKQPSCMVCCYLPKTLPAPGMDCTHTPSDWHQQITCF